MVSHFQTLNEEITAVKEALETEREIERESYLASKKHNKGKLKGIIFEEEVYVTGDLRRFTFSCNLDLKSFPWLKKGAPVYLENGDFALVCQVSTTKEKSITIQCKGEIELPDGDLYQLSAWYSESTYNIYFEAIRVIFGKEETRARSLISWVLGYQANDKQTVSKAYSALSKLDRLVQVSDYLLIFGPPGTGKTTLLANAMLKWRESNHSILAMAPTNFACDYLVEIAIRLGLKPVRLGMSSKIGEEIQPYLIDNLIQSSPEQKQILFWRREWKDLIKKAKSWKRSFGKEERVERKQLFAEAKALQKSIDILENTARNRIVNEADLIVSTFVPAWQFYKDGIKFDYVVVDEATQGLEPAFYLASLLAERLVIAGDPKQLPPTVNQMDSLLKETVLEKGIARDDGQRVLFLNEQFRMPEEILQFSNETFYDNKLITIRAFTDHPRNNSNGISNFQKNLVWIDTAGSDAEETYDGEDESCYNQLEIDLICKLLENFLNFDSIAVLSPYRKQIELLGESVNTQFPDRESRPIIQTIDSFQGREADTIILSFVRTNDLGEIGFLKDYKRLNVGLTRAKERLILVGNSVTLSADKTYDSLIKKVQSIGEYRSIFEFLY